ncbi:MULTISPECIES: DeoR/GlpR family DNA-binding transcription regulator [Streptomyces]|uniref:Lactose phosphotransferase system repressor n=1 Tax=Streptomyces doudnae TaxID=3075536 RepID=A0ABD5ERR6_9ACTN|nr:MULTISPECIES: DeoR/GlpR family DNA-binding transcription regulator [unclassified Streptomyces]MDT0437393.1 DeoR/GlpR family DNA-binding transcription regulator [Streptomyces sp. DSM 41981]MYQ64651.1 DeoR family transcriptional regulator [Streptomyces sp. SID4950]SCD83396.1 transcriptional regulator, DeoR family [Streptomyces sp. SolWspMP-5a-2]
MGNADRLRQIGDAVRAAGSLTVAELAALAGASEMTVRRDLDALAAQGVLERVRGGARSLVLRGEEPPFALRAQDGAEAKARVAAAVVDLIGDGETVVLDSGTTCLEVARLLRGRRVTVMPLSLQAVAVLAEGAGQASLLVPGGRPRPGEGALTGPLALASLAAVRFDTAVIGCCGLAADQGLTAYDLDDAAVKQAAIRSARRVVAATDSGKLTRTAHAFVTPVAALDTLVTDRSAPREALDAIGAAGVTVRTV